MDGWTIGSLLDTAAGYLKDKGSSSPRLDAELLLAHALGMDRIHLYTEYDRPLAPCEVDHYRALIGRRGRREPVAYILKKAHFRHLILEVAPTVLIPRPETEELVEAVLGILKRKPLWESLPDGGAAGDPAAAVDGHAATASRAAGGPRAGSGVGAATVAAPLIADVGCGSGAIALSIAQETGHMVLAIDNSADALAVAERNREALGLADLVVLQATDLLSAVSDGSLRLVVSNPPYVPSGDIDGLEPDVKSFEPLAALDGGADGLDAYRRLLPDAARVLLPGGTVVLEVGVGQAATVVDIAGAAGFAAPKVHKDMSGKDRIVEAARPGTVSLNMSGLSAGRLEALGAALEAGAIVGLPTDTVYGLAASWKSREGVDRLFTAKGRAAAQPVAAVFGSLNAVRREIPDIDPGAFRVMEALLPGPFTFVVATAVPRPPLVGTEDSLGVRIPDHPALLQFLQATGLAVAATSANISGQPAPGSLADVDPSILAHCSAALFAPDEGRPGGTASTVVDLRPLLRGEEPVVVREGAVAADEVLRLVAALS